MRLLFGSKLNFENVECNFGSELAFEVTKYDFWGRQRGGGLGSRPKKMYGERLGDGVECHLMSPTPRR